MTPKWWSQPFAEEGSATAEGIVNQLGRPALEELTVLVREAAQNSWDARIGDQEVYFGVDIRKLGKSSEAWNQLLLPAPAGGDVTHLADHLHPDSVVVTISDRGTRGLGGPLRAGSKPRAGERSDFVQFLRNVGEARDNEFGGGTYGFGKGIFYRLSKCSSIVVDSFTGDGSSHARRLMGAALGSSFYGESDRRFTGRHWWGLDVDNIPDPVQGNQAAEISASLGLPGFDDGTTGTDIVIIGARLESSGPEEGDKHEDALLEAASFMASSILWNLWPKMIPQTDKPKIRFRVTVEGVEVPIPDPLTCTDLKPFASSLVALRDGDNTKYTRSREPKLAGELKISTGPNFGGSESATVTAAKPFDGPAHHIARMRVAELVVDYFAGPPHPDELLTYGGVFRTVRESDGFFAESEPPTHDDWVIAALQGTAKGVVQGSKQFLNKQIAEHIGASNAVAATSLSGLGKLASRLSRLAPGLNSGGAGPAQGSRSGGSSSGSGGGGRSGKKVARIVEQPKVVVFDGRPFLLTRVSVPASDSPMICAAKASVILEGGGRESESFAGADVPTVLQWSPVAGGPVIHGSSIQITSANDTEWWVYASHVADAVTRIELETTYGQR